jgi:Ca2+-binding RTX toxin-like protein
MTAIAVSTATTAVTPRRRRGAAAVGGKLCHPRSGLGGVHASGLSGGGLSGEGSILSIVGGVSANDGPAGAPIGLLTLNASLRLDARQFKEGSRVRRLLLLPITTVVLLSVPNAARAATATACSFDGGTATVTATIGSSESPTLERSGGAIAFDGSPCGAATVTNTDTVNVSAPDQATTEALTISIAGGQFGPGKTTEGDGSDEIEITVTLQAPEALTIIGSAGADDITFLGDVVDLSAGPAGEFEVTRTGFDNTTPSVLSGGAGNDHLRMSALVTSSDFSTNSTVSGGDGDDDIVASPYTNASYDGGAGTDTVSYPNLWTATEGITVHVTTPSVSATVDRFNGPTATDTLTGIERIAGSPLNDTFYGSTGDDWFDGGDGNDWFLPSGGNDTVNGGSGIGDTLTVGASAAPVTFDMTAGTSTGEGTDTFQGIEALQGSPTNDLFTGDPEMGGETALDGYGGNDLLDLRTAQSGQTVYTSSTAYGSSAVVTFGIYHVIGSPFRDRISVYQSPAVGGSVHFTGLGGNDVLIGGPRRDRLDGGPGDDRLNGKGGVDTCSGGSGMDTLLHCEA